MPHGGVDSEIRVFPRYHKALFRLNTYRHLWVMCYFDRAIRTVLRARSRRLANPGKLRGVFCIHSPDRPNPISLTRVELLFCRKGVLRVRGLDALDGTPVLDIKDYRPDLPPGLLPKKYDDSLSRLRRPAPTRRRSFR